MPPPVRPSSATDEDNAGLETLTAREREVLGRLATGARTRAIAEDLGIAEPTVKRHLTNLYRKLGVTNRVEAVTSFLRHRQPRRREQPPSQ